jgi:hypothetical protein
MAVSPGKDAKSGHGAPAQGLRRVDFEISSMSLCPRSVNAVTKLTGLFIENSGEP